MTDDPTLGSVYRCPVCGAEVTVVSPVACGGMRLRCCDTPMEPLPGRAVFYRCPVCGAQVCLVIDGGGERRLICCHTDMQRIAA